MEGGIVYCLDNDKLRLYSLTPTDFNSNYCLLELRFIRLEDILPNICVKDVKYTTQINGSIHICIYKGIHGDYSNYFAIAKYHNGSWYITSESRSFSRIMVTNNKYCLMEKGPKNIVLLDLLTRTEYVCPKEFTGTYNAKCIVAVFDGRIVYEKSDKYMMYSPTNSKSAKF